MGSPFGRGCARADAVWKDGAKISEVRASEIDPRVGSELALAFLLLVGDDLAARVLPGYESPLEVARALEAEPAGNGTGEG